MTNKEVIERLSYLIEDGENGINGLALDALTQALEVLKKQSTSNWPANAPDWANFRAMDADGNWYWFEKEPVKLESSWASTWDGRWAFNTLSNALWETSLQQRPNPTDQ